jgi:hypothetical protein
MAIYFLSYRARPGEKVDDFKRLGGAYVNCWINAVTAAEAQSSAAEWIKHQGWIAEALEEGPRLETQPPEEAREHFEQAQVDGTCYVFHTWPITDRDEEPLH